MSNYLILAIVMPLLTAIVWVIWACLIPSVQDSFLLAISSKVERNLLPHQRRRSKGLRVASMRASK